MSEKEKTIPEVYTNKMKKDSTKYWFKRRRFGWGWVPVTRKGFTVLIVGLAMVLIATLQLPPKPTQPSFSQLMIFFGIIAAVIIGFLIIAYLKGPKPHWRWGTHPDDNPDEDF
jgi:hypothetical protein